MSIMAHLCGDALTVQNASNASGVIFAFRRHVISLGQMGITAIATHPVVVLFADKLDDLCQTRRKDLPEPEGTIEDAVANLADVMRTVCDTQPRTGTDDRNTHPDVQSALLRVLALVGRSFDAYSNAYHYCQEQEAAV